MAADRVPQRGEVWAFTYLAARGRGQVVIDAVLDDRVVYTYRGSGSSHEASLPAFLVHYDWCAATVADAPPQAAPLPADLGPVRPGTAVSS